MPVGEAAFTAVQRQEIDRAVHDAERMSGRDFAVHVGPSDGDSRQAAEGLHASMQNPANSVLVHVDPARRTLEIVTGAAVREVMTNRQAALAALSMQTAFATGDLTRGLRAGLQQLASMSSPANCLHTDTP